MTERGPVHFYLASLLKNVRAGARLAFFMPVRAIDYRVSPLDFALLFALDLVVWMVVAGVRVGFTGELDTSAIVVYLATAPLMLMTALVIALIYRAPERFMPIAVALVASDPVFEVAGLALPALGAVTGLGGTVFFLFLAWVWVAAIRAVKVCAGTARPEYYQGVLVVTGMIALAFFAFPKIEVWQPPALEEEVAALSDERLFHAQGELIARALGAIAPGRPGTPELYFVGFAPDASQDVFLREMRFVKRLFDERFGAAGRSIALASSHTALEELPIASVTNLARALGRVGEAMNTEEDVLFLFLSAHGDREHRLSASQPPLDLLQLTPTALARMLQDSGVKWRVIVVSACYAGGFIEPLRDDNTLIITAAAADRTSFGCEAGRDFTYFGEAYFREALAKTRSFTHAFEMAQDIVAKKEAAEKLIPSQPQLYVGKAIAERLKALDSDKPAQ
jgi:hypothetical protein